MSLSLFYGATNNVAAVCSNQIFYFLLKMKVGEGEDKSLFTSASISSPDLHVHSCLYNITFLISSEAFVNSLSAIRAPRLLSILNNFNIICVDSQP